MLSEIIEQESEDLPQDEDSLFGSPPPSPLARGRSPSPALALPSAASAGPQCWGFGPSAQNVGTIALPGSHTNSEPSINPIAPSLSLPGGSSGPLLPQSLPSSQPQSCQDSTTRSESPRVRPQTSVETRKSTQASKQVPKQKSSTPRPPPPAIPLPDPSEPLPSHFLRNQKALLGHAGLIAGVRPSKLTTLPSVDCGASPSNPIVLDDNDTEIPREPSALMGRSSIEYFKNLHPSQLPTPTTQEVVDMLIRLKDIFPILQSILRLLVSGGATVEQGWRQSAAATGTWGWTSQAGQRQISAQPPVKRRKLNCVPAGAADWDVPYPFLDGEGPKAYRQNWTKDRSRQLVSQLIGLVRLALEKAAAKKHVDKLARRQRPERKQRRGCSVLTDQQVGGKGANHYRDENKNVIVSSTPNATVDVSSDLSTATLDPPAAPTSTPASVVAGSNNTMFNDLLSTLLSVPDPAQCAGVSTSSQAPAPFQPIGTDQSTNNFLATSDLSPSTNEIADQSLVDSWMNILQTFSLSADAPTVSGMLNSDSNSLDFLSGMDVPSDFSTFPSPVSGDTSSFSTTPNPEDQQPLGFSALDFNQMESLDLALDLIASGSPSVTSGQTQVLTDVLTDVSFDLSIPSDDPERSDTQSAPVSDTPTDLDKLTQLSTSPELQNILARTEPLPLNIDALLDPHLLAMSLPHASHASASGIQSAPSTSDADNQMPSNSLPSPPSTLGPVTPTSADCDVTLPGVVVGEQSHASVSTADSNYGKDFGGQPSTFEIGVEVMSTDDSTNISHNEGPRESSSQAAPFNTPVPSSCSVPTTPVPLPATGVFSSVRVEDRQPQKPRRKLKKKADVLKKAQERREELRASLEQTKVKLWGITIEHGVLLQLLRIIGGENVIQPSASGS